MWVSSLSGSGGEPPTREQIQQWRRRMSAPDNEFPAGVGLTVLLGHSSDAAVGITDIVAFSTGFEFMLSVRARRARSDLLRGGLHMLVSSHGHPGINIALQDRLLLGIEYPDGQRASTLQDKRMRGPGAVADGDQQLVLCQRGGGGGELSVNQTYWVSPLPANGPVTFVVAWPGFGIAESRTVIDGAAILAAAERSQVLWPPEPAGEPPEPPPPPRPSSGWFAEPPDESDPKH